MQRHNSTRDEITMVDLVVENDTVKHAQASIKRSFYHQVDGTCIKPENNL